MSSTRNFEFRVSPLGGQRGGRYVLNSGAEASLPIGVPVLADGTDDGLGRAVVQLATGAQDAPKSGQGGVLYYQDVRYEGVDQMLTTYSDMDSAPLGAAVQVVSGDTVKVAFTNTTASTFLNRSGYPTPRVMVAGLGATPTLEAGDFLTPGTGDGTDGYWEATATASEAWLVVTSVNSTTGVVEARLAF
jgi:hypothetical protein